MVFYCLELLARAPARASKSLTTRSRLASSSRYGASPPPRRRRSSRNASTLRSYSRGTTYKNRNHHARTAAPTTVVDSVPNQPATRSSRWSTFTGVAVASTPVATIEYGWHHAGFVFHISVGRSSSPWDDARAGMEKIRRCARVPGARARQRSPARVGAGGRATPRMALLIVRPTRLRFGGERFGDDYQFERRCCLLLFSCGSLAPLSPLSPSR